MSEQAKALAETLLRADWKQHVELTDRVTAAADLIDAAMQPPCPDCGAAVRPSAKWACGSWQDGPARQTSVKCVKRQMAVLLAELEALRADPPIAVIADLVGPQPADAHDGPAVSELSDATLHPFHVDAKRQPPVPPAEPVEPRDIICEGGKKPRLAPPPKPVEPEAQIVKEGELPRRMPPDAMI